MTDVVVLCLIAAALGWCAQLPVVWRTRAERDDALERERAMMDRLLAAWRDGYTVPAEEAEPLELEPLPSELAEVVASYPDPQAQARVEAAIRRKLNAGREVDAILMDAEVGQL